MNLKIRTKDIALIAIYAALYAALVVVLGPFSYGPIQIRIADSLLAVVPLLGLAGVLGHTLGVFVGNIFSIAGPIDLLNTILLRLQTHQKRLYRNWSLFNLLCSFRHNSWMDAFLPVWTATSSHHSLCCYWKCNCKRAYRMAYFQVTKENRNTPKMVRRI
jgi:hypothetical protein